MTALIALVVSVQASAKSDKPETVGHMVPSPTLIQFLPSIDNERIDMTIVAPDGTTMTAQFPNGKVPSVRLQDLFGGRPSDGAYLYELRVIPRIPEVVKRQLAAARAANDDASIRRIQHANGIDTGIVQSGTLTILNGVFINSDADEPGANSAMRFPSAMASSTGSASASSMYRARPAPLDVVVADDQIVQGSLCVGLDCVNNESFGFDTIRLKENNTRIKFDDTSTSPGFPNVNWQLTANDSASGGANKFSIDDVTNAKTPFTVTANAPTNSLFVASSGKVGFGNGAPALNIHITATDTPAIRQEQTSGGGFTAQTWDIGANEANWFVRDVTGGSRLPLRIRPGAPTSSLDIQASGNVGINTAAAAARLEVNGTTQFDNIATWASSGAPQGYVTWNGSLTSTFNVLGASGKALSFGSNGVYDRLYMDTSGNVGIGTTAPTSRLQVVGLPVYANNAAAVAGGLTAGALYRTGGDPDLVAIVH